MTVTGLLLGIAFTGFAASGIFFLKFWIAARDRFYLYFCIACWLLATERLALIWADAIRHPIRSPQTEASSWVYLLRLGAFVFILIAIIAKNRSTKEPRRR